MPEPFPWVPEVARGAWLRGMAAQEPGSLPSVVPAGFEAYARIFHPVTRDRPLGTGARYGVDRQALLAGAEGAATPLETQPATWAQAAGSFGATMHAEAQYDRLLRRAGPGEDRADGAIAPDGWRYADTEKGRLEVGSLAVVAAVLARHTTTPARGIAAIWEGWGGLVSSAGSAHWVMVPTVDVAGGRTGAGRPTRLAAPVRRGLFRVRSMIEARRGPPRVEPAPGTGLLPRDIAVGARFTPRPGTGRDLILFEAGAEDFARTDWPARAPWADEAAWAPSPSILWPEDHAWVLATEIDLDSTLVAGTAALIHELLGAPGLETLPLRVDADLSSEGDELNGPV